ncbi:hypothetical protein HJC23_001803 [Cyclotella cryptica]|uniref:Methyltransferase domain-containing protein n=1 Tax=Cyclotella cryptica TaxID=29204 RepID=A0ABD3PI37_9STRA
MPPLKQQQQRHSLDYGVRTNHPTSYDDNPSFKGPLVLQEAASSNIHRRRIRGHYLNNKKLKEAVLDESDVYLPVQLSACASTATIIKSIVDHLARNDAPIDIKEVAESTEFYLRSGKRLFGAARRVLDNKPNTRESDNSSIITIHDLCSGHGLTGMLFVACNPPRDKSRGEHIRTVLVDRSKPQSHEIVRNIISEVCPWVNENSVKFKSSSLEHYVPTAKAEHGTSIIISTHACGSLTDDVLNFSVEKEAAAVAVMPCCYTGTDAEVPYGLRRMLGVSLSADVRRSFFMQSKGYHVDFATIPRAVSPMNRIIIAEQRK